MIWIILGGGPQDTTPLSALLTAVLKTLVIEKRALGGVCLNEGCIPTKNASLFS